MLTEKDKQQVKELAERRFFVFMCLINPHYAYGDLHQEMCDWMQDDPSNRRLALVPRAHLKSHLAAGYAAWRITKAPWITIVYLSAGEDLAKNQIYAIKNMMTSDVYRTYWPEMLEQDEGQREQWSAYSFNVDHPERKRRGIRDHTIIVKTVKSNAIGLHCDLLIPDDVVIPQFADTATGRSEVNRSMAQFTSILNPRGEIVGVGTRYHPEDFYQTCIDSEYQVWDEKLGRFNGTKKMCSIFIRQVEDKGDGTGEFIWPLTQSADTGNAYGFDVDSLAVIRADYEAKGQLVQFYCQYYNDPNAIDTQRISRGHFQYFDRKNLKVERGSVFLRNTQLATFAAMDVAWTDGENSDYTAIVVIGMDSEENVYVLDLVQFKTDSFNDYFNEVISLHRKWDFKKLLIETNAGGHFVKQELDRLVRQYGETLSIEGKAAPKQMGSKTERKQSTLEWRYADMKCWHYKGGLTSEFEDQIVLGRPRHDDLVDAYVAAISIAKPPGRKTNSRNIRVMETSQTYDSRFGGRRGRAA